MSDDTYHGWTNRETWAFMMLTNQDPNRQAWSYWRSQEILMEWPDAHPRAVGEKLVEETRDWARQFYGRNETATAMIHEVGSFWRVDDDEVGRHILADAEEAIA